MDYIDYIEKDLMKYRDGRPMRRIDFLSGWCIFFCLLMALVPMVVLRFFTGIIFGDEIINNLYYLLSLYIICFVVVLWFDLETEYDYMSRMLSVYRKIWAEEDGKK